jgi:hypothetical protein
MLSTIKGDAVYGMIIRKQWRASPCLASLAALERRGVKRLNLKDAPRSSSDLASSRCRISALRVFVDIRTHTPRLNSA